MPSRFWLEPGTVALLRRLIRVRPAFIGKRPTGNGYIVDSLIETVAGPRRPFQMSKVAKPVLLRHFFALAATLPPSASPNNQNARQLHDAGNTTTLANYLKLLEAAFLVSGLELFSLACSASGAAAPKLVLWNNAPGECHCPHGALPSPSPIRLVGRLVENAVGAYLCSSNSQFSGVQCYLLAGGCARVDFVVSRAGTFGRSR